MDSEFPGKLCNSFCPFAGILNLMKNKYEATSPRFGGVGGGGGSGNWWAVVTRSLMETEGLFPCLPPGPRGFRGLEAPTPPTPCG